MIVVQWSDWIHVRREGNKNKRDLGEKQREREKKQMSHN